jgi:hypothetical protein
MPASFLKDEVAADLLVSSKFNVSVIPNPVQQYARLKIHGCERKYTYQPL